MATASTIHFTRQETPAFCLPGVSNESASRTSELLQENHEKHHIFFNKSGFHNHIAHHLCTLYSLNASPEVIQRQYDSNKSYQRSPVPLDSSVVGKMNNPDQFKRCLGDERNYHDYLEYFQSEMESKGWQAALNEYLFSGDERADDMLVRLYAGFLHPIIHLGFGVEFQQPAIMAEALAQAAVHDNWMKSLFIGAEELAAQTPSVPSKTMVQLLEEAKAKPQLREAAASTSNNRIRDGILKHEAQTMIDIVAQYKVDPSDLDFKNAEMTNACAYFSGAAQRIDKVPKFDFYYMHCINCSIFFDSFLKQDWLSTANKVRLLEWKGRNDITMYASRGSPDLILEEIVNYKPKKPIVDAKAPWSEVFTRVCQFEEDGHAAKLVRALAHGQKICEPYEDRPEFEIKHDMWLQLGHMAIDSVTADDGIQWVRSCGFDEAWKHVTDKPEA